MVETNHGLVEVILNNELLFPGAQTVLASDRWFFTIQAESKLGERFLDQKMLSRLPKFDDREPNASDFEHLFDHRVDSELNLLGIVTQVCARCFLDITDGKVRVFLGPGECVEIFTFDASSDSYSLRPSAL
jgi:hypothetical protein